MRSIERYLLARVLVALGFGAGLVALVVYLAVLEEMNEVFDAELESVALAAATHRRPAPDPDGATASAPARPTGSPAGVETVMQTWTSGGRLLSTTHPGAGLPFTAAPGLSRLHVGAEDWSVFASARAGTIVQTAQPLSARRELARESAVKALPLLLGWVVAIGGLLVFFLRRGLRPLDRAAGDVATRSATSLDPIALGDVPREIAPLVASVNGLLGRLAAALATQRRFLADAAHALRTPVTALRLQLQLLERSADAASRRDALAELQSGIDRTQRLVEQLLDVARSEPDGDALREESVALGELVRSAVGGLSARADQRGIDLGADGPPGIVVRGDRQQLAILLDNLVDNALRYTPRGGVVDVAATLRDGRPALRVVDDGPGIPPHERERVFDRFHRGEGARAGVGVGDSGGTGLGLAIVRSIAERHGASVTLHAAGPAGGLEVRVEFPAAAG